MFKKGQVYWCNFNNAKNNENHIQLGFRPALIISKSEFNKKVLAVAPLTAKLKGGAIHMMVNSKKYDNLNFDSEVLLEQMKTVDASILGDFICELDEFDLFKLDVKLSMFLNLFNPAENKFAKEILKTVRYLHRIDGIITNHENVDEYILLELLKKREQKLRSLEIICEKMDVNINDIYKSPNLNKIHYVERNIECI